MRFYLLLLTVFLGINGIAQTDSSKSNEIFQVTEGRPEYPGGPTAMLLYLQKNIKYPALARENGVEGRVIIRFVIDTDGSVINVEHVGHTLSPKDSLSETMSPLLIQEALRVVKAMPKWKPGTQRGEPVKVRMALPILYRLE